MSGLTRFTTLGAVGAILILSSHAAMAQSAAQSELSRKPEEFLPNGKRLVGTRSHSLCEAGPYCAAKSTCL